MSANAPQPPPKPGSASATWNLVILDMRERDAMGAVKYGIRHQHDNGRDHLIDAYQECLDQALYLRAEIERRKGVGDLEKRARDWISGGDTGLSSETLWNFFIGNRGFRSTTPLDPDDFGRCYRLLKKFPEWKERLGEVAIALPEWKALINVWPEMEQIYERDLSSGRSPELYQLMQKLERRR